MPGTDMFSEEFARAAALAGLQARQDALLAGHAVVFIDDLGRYVKEFPDGRLFEVRLQPSAPREHHVQVIRELSASAD